jgi:Fe2+ transport system protein FeoA
MIFNFRKNKKQHCHQNCCCKNNSSCENPSQKNTETLSNTPENERVRILANADLKTMEMGIYPGAIITLIQNSPSAHNIIVKVHDQRFVVPKKIADNIIIRKSK